MKGWHFAQDDKRLGYGDGRKIIVGRKLKHKGEIVLCKSGLHASKRAIDALKYARGNYACRVKLSGKIIHDTDKSVATERAVLWAVDAEKILRTFARRCALDVIHLWDAPDVVMRYLKTGDESLRSAARSVAHSAAYPSPRWAAYWAAYWAADSMARWAPSWAADWAANSAADSAADSAARDKQNRRLTRMLSAARKK